MGVGSVAPKDWRTRPSWKLAPKLNTLAQGLVVSGFASKPSGAALFLEFAWSGEPGSGRGEWLRTLERVAPVTDADNAEARPAALAFTWTGLEKMGLPAEALDSFSDAFREGMCQEDRLRRLGDRYDGKWLETVVEGGYQWSGNRPLARDENSGEAPWTAAKTVHALLMLYAADEAEVKGWVEQVAAALEPHQIRIVHQLPLDLRVDEEHGIGREHFGFADGMSQPIPYEDGSVVFRDGSSVPRDPWHGVALGEILIGHVDAHHQVAPGPVVKAEKGRNQGSLPLKEEGAPAGFLNLGLNGSYMVVRELRQKVPDFWLALDASAEKIRQRDPQHSSHVTADWLAEQVVGRNVDGHLLCPAGFLGPDEYGQPENAFGFLDSDPHGQGCPPGSHVRRSNPRDGLAKDKNSAQTLLDAANNHRLLRRGRKFGKTIKDPRVEDNEQRGLLFVCLNTDIARQFEFVQQVWLLNRNFATLFDETDPLVGPKGRMTIKEKPLRRIVEVDTFVQVAGGEYFFLPSMPTLGYLAEL